MAFTALPEVATVGVMQFRLTDWAENGVLAGRVQAEKARSNLTEELQRRRSEPEAVGIDLEGIEVMSFPFADSFFGPLLLARRAGYYIEHPIVVFEANQDVAETIDAVMHKQSTAIVAVDGQTKLLGGEPALKHALTVAAMLGSFSATRLGAELHVTPQGANNRLKALIDLGALVRVPILLPGGGREFEYRIPDMALTKGHA
jgi:hypothetical protein